MRERYIMRERERERVFVCKGEREGCRSKRKIEKVRMKELNQTE